MLAKETTEFSVTEQHLRQRRKNVILTVVFIAVLCTACAGVSLYTALLALRGGDTLPGVLFGGLFVASLFPLLASQRLYSRLIGQLEHRRVTLKGKKLIDADDRRERSVALGDIKRLEVLRDRQGDLLAFNVQTEARTVSFAGLNDMDTLLAALSNLKQVSVTERTKWLNFGHVGLQVVFYVVLGGLLLFLSETLAPTLTPSLLAIVLTTWFVVGGALQFLQSAPADTHYLREKRRSSVTLIILGVLVMGLELL